MNKLVLMEDVIGDMASEYGIPVITFDNLVALGKLAVNVYNLQDKGKKISFDDICVHIKKYIETPFGMKELKRLL